MRVKKTMSGYTIEPDTSEDDSLLKKVVDSLSKRCEISYTVNKEDAG